MRVSELLPGMVIEQPDGTQACFVAQTEHPLWPHLRLVIWRMGPESKLPGGWSHDALDARQEVGVVAEPPNQERLRGALLTGRWY